MEILYIFNTLILGYMLWDIHTGTKEIINVSKEISAKTDELLNRVPHRS